MRFALFASKYLSFSQKIAVFLRVISVYSYHHQPCLGKHRVHLINKISQSTMKLKEVQHSLQPPYLLCEVVLSCTQIFVFVFLRITKLLPGLK